MKRCLTFVAVVALATNVAAELEISKQGQESEFYVYKEAHFPHNHFIPSGWMGDVRDLKYAEVPDAHPGDKTAIKIVYQPTEQSEQGWAGIYWQDSVNNWGNRASRYNLNGYSKLTFWARSAGKEPLTINEVKMGGITGQYSDSDSASLGEIQVPTKWTKFTLDLKGHELSSVIGGFCIAMNRDSNPDGFTLYLDEIRYEK